MQHHDPEWSRHHRVRPDNDFRDAIWLAGFDEQSVWGYDTGVESFFAQLWDNESDAEDPDLWLTPPSFSSNWPHALVPPIVAFTEATPVDVVRALGIARPTPKLITDGQLADLRNQLPRDSHEPYFDGQRRALDWLLGNTPHAPCSGTATACGNSRPTAEEVDAESALASGELMLTRDPVAGGVEEALITSLRR